MDTIVILFLIWTLIFYHLFSEMEKGILYAPMGKIILATHHPKPCITHLNLLQYGQINHILSKTKNEHKEMLINTLWMDIIILTLLVSGCQC